MVDTISNVKLVDLNTKIHGGKSLGDLIDCTIGAHFKPLPGSYHHTIIHLENFHGTNNHQENSYDKPITK